MKLKVKSKKRNKKPKRIGEMTNSRGEWQINPVTRVKESNKKYNRNKEKQKIRRGDY
ncbi:hypothetical protein [Bacillus phage vB_BsuS_PJN02]|uniref:Uncharacterized protein n=1 Tax=Bacillus phage vB_BsuS_PJN02 TaxID=2920374 RepID=A0AC61TS60_9CAUD|nr:hypothetical protein PQE76_gp191 [Bacillus phage vB_BsuS_PJN02]UNH58534.1 hypothetical protein [Bacillus phage vB_BsuS_PJN02]